MIYSSTARSCFWQ